MKIDAVLTAERYSETGSAKNIVRDKLVVDVFIARIGRPATALGDILHPVNLADTRMRTAPLRRSEPGQHLRRETLRERHTAQRRRLCAHGFNRRLDLVRPLALVHPRKKRLSEFQVLSRPCVARVTEVERIAKSVGDLHDQTLWRLVLPDNRYVLVLCNASIRIERKVLDAADDAIRLGCARIEEFVKRHLCVLKEIVSPGNR